MTLTDSSTRRRNALPALVIAFDDQTQDQRAVRDCINAVEKEALEFVEQIDSDPQFASESARKRRHRINNLAYVAILTLDVLQQQIATGQIYSATETLRKANKTLADLDAELAFRPIRSN